MYGWIKLHRQLLKSRAWLSADAEGKVILVTLLLKAAHADVLWQINTNKNVLLHAGELFTTNRKLAKICNVSDKKIRVELSRLSALGFLDAASRKEGTILRIRNWAYYQDSEGTPLDSPRGTALGTPLEKAVEVDWERDTINSLSRKNTALGTPQGAALGTPLDSHNKNIYILKNKINKKNINEKAISDAMNNKILLQAESEYLTTFTAPNQQLSLEVMRLLAKFTIVVSDSWILRAVRELIATNKGKVVRNPQSYLLGILLHWLDNGIPNDRKGEEDSLASFYREVGVGGD